jgi:hypothetical protein
VSVNLTRLKAEMQQRWPRTSLLDFLKEADLRIRFTDRFRTMTSRETLDRETPSRKDSFWFCTLWVSMWASRELAPVITEKQTKICSTFRKSVTYPLSLQLS